MKFTTKLFQLSIFLFFLSFQTLKAQSKDDLMNGSSDVTWLGMDFTQTKFIGSASQFKDAGEVTNAEFRDKFIPAWNGLFVNEEKKYNVAKAVHRTEIKHGMEVTEKVNKEIKKDFFTNNPDEYMSLDAEKVAALVKKYNFQGKSGIGLIFFIEGMSKAKDQASAWAAYVDMKSKSIIMSQHLTGKAGGFGFRNYWAKAFHGILEDADYKEWK